jgi:hypothetical protein
MLTMVRCQTILVWYQTFFNAEGEIMFNELKEINKRPKPFEFYTASELWTNEHTAKQMFEYHLNDTVDAASRNRGFTD